MTTLNPPGETQDEAKYVSDMEVLIAGLTLATEQSSGALKERAEWLIDRLRSRQERAGQRLRESPADLHAFALANQLEFQIRDLQHNLTKSQNQLHTRETELKVWKAAFETLATAGKVATL